MDGGEVAFRYAVEYGEGDFPWIEDNCSYALSANLDCAQLLAVGRVVCGQLAALEAAHGKWHAGGSRARWRRHRREKQRRLRRAVL